jgi:hypothetical protein
MRPEAKTDARTAALFDLKGTLIHHESRSALPMMPWMLSRLIDAEYKVAVLTSYDAGSARHLCKSVGFLEKIPIFSGWDRPNLVREALEHLGQPTRGFYFDDKPGGLQEVATASISALDGRVLGFTGSRYYCPKLAQACVELRIPLALSPYDVLHRLGELGLFEEFCEKSLIPESHARDVGFLIPGLIHPFSVFGGDAERMIHVPLKQVPPEGWEQVWLNIGWIGAAASGCTLLLKSVVRHLHSMAISSEVQMKHGAWPMQRQTT